MRIKRLFCLLSLIGLVSPSLVAVCYSDGEPSLEPLAAAQEGDAQAQYDLALCYSKGDGVPRDYKESGKWLKKAALQGHSDAQAALGTYYYLGMGVERDQEEGTRWMHKSADQGNSVAQYMLAGLYVDSKNFTEAFRLFSLAAENGHAGSQHRLGVFYLGGRGVPKDHEAALLWLTKSAEQGYVLAQNLLGRWYADGEMAPPDYEAAVKWYRKAAEQGHAVSQVLLGFCYIQGEGVPKDMVEGCAWGLLAADNGVPDLKDFLKDKLSLEQIANGAIRAMELKKEFAKQAESDATGDD